MTELSIIKPCPFCSSTKTVVIGCGIEDIGKLPSSRPHYVCCDECGAAGPEVAPYAEAIHAWNKRPVENHWRSNHKSVVKKSRILIERLDMPIDRVQAFQHMVEMDRELCVLHEKLRLLKKEHDL